MGDRGVAPVVDLAEVRARRGAQIGRGQLRRVNPARRPPRMMMVVDWEAYGKLDRAEVVAVERGAMRPPMRVKGWRRIGVKLSRRAVALSRAQRRLAWKVESREAGVGWADSRSARGELAPVIPVGHRGTVRRLPPVGIRGERHAA